MNTVKNVLIKKYIKLESLCELCSGHLRILGNSLDNLDVDNFDESKFDEIVSQFSKGFNINNDDEYLQEVQEFLNVSIDIKLDNYLNMIKTINNYYITKKYLKTLLTKEEKINYLLLD